MLATVKVPQQEIHFKFLQAQLDAGRKMAHMAASCEDFEIYNRARTVARQRFDDVAYFIFRTQLVAADWSEITGQLTALKIELYALGERF